MTVPRQDLGAALWRLAELVRADEGRRSFRSKAYRTAVWSLDDLPADLEMPAEEMLKVAGIGPGVLRLISEFREEGRLEALERLDRSYPHDVSRLRRLPRMTPALLRALKAELGVEEADDLIGAVESGAIETIRGVGEATAERWARTLRLWPSPRAVPAFQGLALAETIRRHLDRHLDARSAVSGAIRRLEEWVESIDLVVEAEPGEATTRFLEDTAIARHLEAPASGHHRMLTHDRVELRVHITPPGGAGSMLLETTGPPEHVAALLGNSPAPAETEAEIYQRNSRPWVPPPARALPIGVGEAVIRTGELRGDLHLHSQRSPDGRMSIEEICAVAVDRGYEYVLITDHTLGLRFGGLDEAGLEEQRAEIDRVRDLFPGLSIFQGAELNIGRDGGLDISDEALALLDMAVAGVHSNMDLERDEQTARVLAALAHPAVRVLAHPTARRIGLRPGIDLDMEAVISAAIEHGVALEVNGHRDRLDLSAPLAARAFQAGALIAADSDAHRIAEMGNVANAVGNLQKAGVPARSVVNTLPMQRFRDWLSRVGPFSADGAGV